METWNNNHKLDLYTGLFARPWYLVLILITWFECLACSSNAKLQGMTLSTPPPPYTQQSNLEMYRRDDKRVAGARGLEGKLFEDVLP